MGLNVEKGAERQLFWGLMALAMLARAVQFDVFAVYHPDEVLQYLEPANRLVNGFGIVTWEYRYGMRPMAIPLLLAGPMAIGQWLGGALGGIVAARLSVAVIALVPIWAAWRISRQVSLVHAILAAGVMACWFEQVKFATHLLSETLAMSLWLGGAALILTDRRERSRLVAGAAFAASAVARFHYAPAAALFLLLALRGDVRAWGRVLVGGSVVLALSALVDLWFGQWPFEWIWTNLSLNLGSARSHRFGIDPPSFLLGDWWVRYGPVLLPILGAAGWAALRRTELRPLAWAAVLTIAAHSLVAHKEYRFILLAVTIVTMLAAIGMVDIASRVRRAGTTALIAVLALGWTLSSLWLVARDPVPRPSNAGPNGMAMSAMLGADHRVCAIGVVARDYPRVSLAYAGRDLPIILLRGSRPPSAELAPPDGSLVAVNAVIASDGMAGRLPGFDRTACRGEGVDRRCLYRRPGPCTPNDQSRPREIQLLLKKFDL